MKYLLMALLATVLSAAQAKPVAKLVESQGSLVLTDEKCTLFPNGYHFQAYNKKLEKTFVGCWLQDESGMVLLVSQFGVALEVPGDRFKKLQDS